MSTYYSDKPIEKHSEDLLDRAFFARLLSKTLLNLNGSDTFTVGLFGKWGAGKTSIVNMALQEIESTSTQNEVIIVRFEPWHFSDASQLLSQFFVRLSSEFKSKTDERLNKIGKAIEKYSNAFDIAKLIPVCGEVISDVAKFGAIRIGKRMQNNVDDSDIISKKQDVIKLLKNQKNSIIVVIDDIDRLSSEQIRLVFQLVSSVAKFPNTAYLLVFDKEIVVKALRKVQDGNGEDYLEKVIQMPIQIPEIPKEKLHSVLFNRLEEVLSSYPKASFYKEHWQEIFAPCVAPFISNLRDINRLCNALQFKMTTISSEIDFADMVAISAIEIGRPKVYEWIKIQKEMLTSSEPLYAFGAREKSQSEWLEFYEKEINVFLKSENNSTDELNIVITALVTLFPSFGHKVGKTYRMMDMDTFRRRNLIAHPEKVDRYFYYDIDKVSIKRSDIENAVLFSPPETFVEFLIDNDKKNLGITVLKEIQAMITELSPDRAKLLFEALILSADDLKTIERKSILSVGAAAYSKHLCIDLLEQVASNERKSLLISLIENASMEELNTLAVFINMIELGYGRLAANGVPHNYKKVITVEELEGVERAFTDRTKELLEHTNLFDCKDWRMPLHFMESFDEDFIEKYLQSAFKENKNVLIYLWDSVSLWTGAGNSYEVHDNYKKYLSEERVLKAIQDEVGSRNIFSLQADTIFRCAAFYLHSLEQVEPDMHIPQASVDKLIETWKVSGIQ